MKIFKALGQVSKILQPYSGAWAICGGVAASLYRETPRFTGDIDIAIRNVQETSALEMAEKVVRELGYSPIYGFVSDQRGKQLPGPALILGRETVVGTYLGIDFLLPCIPWVTAAVERSQTNLLDYGFAHMPTILPEDLIVAKLFAYQGTPERRQDLDDVESMVRNMPSLDWELILESLATFGILVPVSIQKLRNNI